MPPIDPRLIAPTSPGVQPQPFPGAAASVPFSLPPRVQQEQADAAERLRLARVGASREDTKLPGQVEATNLANETAKLKLREERLKQGLDPDTGKPSEHSGKIGAAVLEDYSPEDQIMIKNIIKGKIPISQYALTRNPKLYQLTQAAFQVDPGTDLATFQRRSVALQKFLSNPNSPMLRVNQALQHLGRFAENTEKLHNSDTGLTNPLNVVNYAKTGYKALNKEPDYEAVATDRDALATELAAAFAGSGQGGALADREEWKKRLSLANSPEGFHKIIQEAVGLLGGRVEASNSQFKQAVGVDADFYDLMSPEAKKVYEQYAPDAPVDTSGGLSTSENAIKIPKGYQEGFSAALKEHPPGTLTVEQYGAIRKSLDQQFQSELPPTAHTDLSDAQAFVDKYNKGATVGEIPDIREPKSKLEKGLADIATSAPAIALESGGNALTLGALDLAAGQSGRDKMEAAVNRDGSTKIANVLGEVAGSVAPIGLAENTALHGLEMLKPSTLEKLGIDVSKLTTRQRVALDTAANAAYGGVRGFNGADDGEGVEGALQGTAAGSFGAVLGTAATKGVTPILSAATQDALKTLKGVDLTTLQRLGFGRTEEVAAKVPIVHGAVKKANESMNKVNANRALGYINPELGVKTSIPKSIPAGTKSNDFMNKQLNAAYEVIKPKIGGTVDKYFDTGMATLRAMADTPEKKAYFRDIQSAINKFKNPKTGAYTGQGYRDASDELRGLMKDLAAKAEGGDTAARHMLPVAEKARKQLQFQIQRTNPALAADLKGIERGWAHSIRIEDASNRAIKDDGVYSPGQYLLSVKKLDTSTRKGLSARGKAFEQQFGEAASKIMGPEAISAHPSLWPTAATAGIATGGGFLAPGVAQTAGAAGTLAYMPGIKRITQALLTGKRPGVVDNDITRRALEDYFRHVMTGN